MQKPIIWKKETFGDTSNFVTKDSQVSSSSSSRTYLFEPDFSSTSTFTRLSFERDVQQHSGMCANRKRVRFASQRRLETSYLISNRHGSQDMSVQVEELLNRIRYIRRAIRKDSDEIAAYDGIGLELEESIWEMKSQCTPEVSGNMNAKQVISALIARSNHLEQETLELRMLTLRRKGKTNQLQKQVEELHRWGGKRGGDTKEVGIEAQPTNRTTLSIARALWVRATGGVRDGVLVRQEQSNKNAPLKFKYTGMLRSKP